MTGVVGFLARSAVRLGVAALLRAGIRRLWPGVKTAIAEAGIAGLLRKFWLSAAAMLSMLIVIGVTVAQALFAHGAAVHAASVAIQSQRLSQQVQALDSTLNTVKSEARAVLLIKRPKAAAAQRAAAAKLLQLPPLAESAGLTATAVERQRQLLAALTAKAAIPLTLPKKPRIAVNPTLIARVEQLKDVPKRSSIPVSAVGLAWAFFVLKRKVIRRGAMMLLPVKVLVLGAAVAGMLACAMQYAGLTFSTAAITLCALATLTFGLLVRMEATR